MPVNWMFEYFKWRQTLKVSEARITEQATLHSFLAGIITGMLTPNMLGNFVGRMFYFQRRYRVSITILTLLTNYAQFITSVLVGIAAILILGQTPIGQLSNGIVWTFCILIPLVLLLYFNFDKIVMFFFPKRHKIFLRIRGINNRRSFLLNVSLLSLIRHLIFTIQFVLVLYTFGADLSSSDILWILQYYFWVTLAPSIFLGKIIVRDSVALWVLPFAGIAPEIILPASISVWIINLLFPTLLALYIVKQKS
jgi:hypothetical protein